MREIITLSMHTVKGLDTEGSMRLMGKIGERDVVVLVDSGATRNFINQRLAEELRLPVTNNKGFRVKVADGHVINGKTEV